MSYHFELSDEAKEAWLTSEEERFNNPPFGWTSDDIGYDVLYGGRIKWEKILTPESYKDFKRFVSQLEELNMILNHLAPGE